MSGRQSVRWLAARIAAFAVAAMIGSVVSAAAQETVSITVPTAVSFQVMDVSRSASGAPSPTTISFSNANLTVALPGLKAALPGAL